MFSTTRIKHIIFQKECLNSARKNIFYANKKLKHSDWVWWYPPLIPALRQKQEDLWKLRPTWSTSWASEWNPISKKKGTTKSNSSFSQNVSTFIAIYIVVSTRSGKNIFSHPLFKYNWEQMKRMEKLWYNSRDKKEKN